MAAAKSSHQKSDRRALKICVDGERLAVNFISSFAENDPMKQPIDSGVEEPPLVTPGTTPASTETANGMSSTRQGDMLRREKSEELAKRRQEELARLGPVSTHD